MEAKELRFLVAVDGSSHSDKALKKAAMLAFTAINYDIAVVYVVEVNEFASLVVDATTEEMEARGNKVLNSALELLALDGVTGSAHLLHGQPVNKILEFAETYHPDLIVTGSRGMSAAKSALIGSVSASISNRAKVSVLIVK